MIDCRSEKIKSKKTTNHRSLRYQRHNKKVRFSNIVILFIITIYDLHNIKHTALAKILRSKDITLPTHAT